MVLTLSGIAEAITASEVPFEAGFPEGVEAMVTIIVSAMSDNAIAKNFFM
jgi:hypothetical protein